MAKKPLIAITGASSGNGVATAKAISDAGHPNLTMPRSLGRMEALGQPNSICVQADACGRVHEDFCSRTDSEFEASFQPGFAGSDVKDYADGTSALPPSKAEKVEMGGGIGTDVVAEQILQAYQLPQNTLVQETCIPPARQKY